MGIKRILEFSSFSPPRTHFHLHRCAILSHTDTDRIASRFGIYASDDDLAAGLEALLRGDAWRDKGEAGYAWVHENFRRDAVIDRHVAAYRRLTTERA